MENNAAKIQVTDCGLIGQVQDVLKSALLDVPYTHFSREQAEEALKDPEKFKSAFTGLLLSYMGTNVEYRVRYHGSVRVYVLKQPCGFMNAREYTQTIASLGYTPVSYGEHVAFNVTYPWIAATRDILSGSTVRECARGGKEMEFVFSGRRRDGDGWQIYSKIMRGIYDRYSLLVRVR